MPRMYPTVQPSGSGVNVMPNPPCSPRASSSPIACNVSSSNAIAAVCHDEPTVRVSNMTWVVNVYADIPLAVPSEELLRQSPMFSAWESVGGVQRRITLTVPDTAAGDAESACEVAKREVEARLTLLKSIADCAATGLDSSGSSV